MRDLPMMREESDDSAVFARLKLAEQARKQHRRKRGAAVWFTRVAILVVFLALWQWGADSGVIDTLFFSSPSLVWAFLVEIMTSSEIYGHIGVTLGELFLAFVIGSAAGVFIALLRSSFTFLSDVSGPYLTILNALPRVALAPMFIIWFGIGETSKVAIAVSMVFFIMMVGTEAGARSIEQEYVTSMRAMGATKAQVFVKLLLPATVPAIFGGLRLAVTYSLLGVVFGEMLASRAGLGQQIQYYASTFRTDGVFGLLLVLALIALALNALVVFIESRLLRWQGPVN